MINQNKGKMIDKCIESVEVSLEHLFNKHT